MIATNAIFSPRKQFRCGNLTNLLEHGFKHRPQPQRELEALDDVTTILAIRFCSAMTR
jgi:hypothetical protein